MKAIQTIKINDCVSRIHEYLTAKLLLLKSQSYRHQEKNNPFFYLHLNMSTSDLLLHYDGICVYATSKVKLNIGAIMILTFANLVLLAAITLFAIEGLPVPSIVFGLAELFMIKYTLWNFFGEERLIINDKSLSYQQHYGFFTTALQTIPFNKKIWIIDYDKVILADICYVKFQVQSYDENSLPEVIYHSVLNITEADFKIFLQYIDRLFIDDLVREHAMPEINLN